jgi:hypothetical protein
MRLSLSGIQLPKSLTHLGEEAETFDGVFQRGIVGEVADCRQDSLFVGHLAALSGETGPPESRLLSSLGQQGGLAG